ncbi:MAG: ROK family protein, partial [Anaerolineae bacterium]|nr:ROK family protein [Anaerolineae bacterium]
TLGTGIGGGVAINGELHLGLSGRAGEFGHLTVDLNGILDGTGAPGTIEALGSGPAIASAGVRAVMQGVNSRIGGLVGYDITRITPDVVMRAAEQADAVALDILHRAGTAIGLGISNVLNVLAPHCVVFGGGVAALGEWIFRPIRETLRRYNSLADLDRLAMVQAALGADAGGIGAALWAFQRQRAKER